jgi:hypothetical protein
MYSQVQYFGCHRIKYNDDPARRTRVYPMIFGMKRNTMLWLINGLDATRRGSVDDASVLP